MEQQGAYYAVIPADVRYDPDLPPNAKLLYGEITSLTNKAGYCWATNEYFADLDGLSVKTISRLIGLLEAKGYIRCEMASTEKGSERRIYAGVFVVAQGGMDKNEDTTEGGMDKNEERGLDKNVQQNNKQDNNKKEKINKKEKATTAPEWKPERFELFWKAYPRGENKQGAIRAWDKLRPDDDLLRAMAMALKRQMATEDWQRGIGIPHASTWLNQRRWEDEQRDLPTPPADTGQDPAPQKWGWD